MADMTTELRALLLATPALAQLVGTRVDWGSRPQGSKLPNVVLHLIDEGEGVTQKGRDGLLQARVQIDAWADTFGEARLLQTIIRERLNGYRGGGLQGVFLVGSRLERDGEANEAGRPYGASLDFLTHWSAENG